jgi:N-methylhydantoinase B
VKDDEISVDLAGSADQVDGYAINMPFVGTVDVAIWLTLRSILLDSELFGEIPQNDGLFRPIHISAPKGCIANPRFPAPTIARFAPGNVVADTVMRALSEALPHQISAGVANLKAVTFSGIDGSHQWVHIEIFEGSYGGRFGKDGMDCVDTLYANTRNNPIEDIESHVPLRVTQYEFRDEAIAPGKWRGGMNSVKEICFLTDGVVSTEGDGHGNPPWGFQGGASGMTSSLELTRADQEPIELPSMMASFPIRRGDRIKAVGGIGGGYGDPLERSASDVLDDVLDGLLDRAGAESSFGVVIDEDLHVDSEATDALRRERLRA